MTKEFGPYYGNRKAALSRFALVNPSGRFVGGRVFEVDGEIMRSTSARVNVLDDDSLTVTVDMEPASTEEATEYRSAKRVAEIQRDMAHLSALIGSDWSNTSGNHRTAQFIEQYRQLESELKSLEVGKSG